MTEENNKWCNNILGKFKTQEEIDLAYQQFARLEQENNSLQAELNNITVQSNNAITALEQENRDLKKQIESQKGLITVGGKQQYKYLQEIDKLKQENEDLIKQLNALKPENVLLHQIINKYELAFEEIRDYLNTLSSVDSDFVNTETYLRINNKIDEVLNS